MFIFMRDLSLENNFLNLFCRIEAHSIRTNHPLQSICIALRIYCQILISPICNMSQEFQQTLHCKMGVFEQADGSAYLEMGNTIVIAVVYGPHGVKKGAALHDRAYVNCQYSQATFSTIERKKKPRADIRSLELTNNIREIFDSVILTNLFPNSQIDIFLEVLQTDGGNMSACINAATLALIHAGIPIKDFVISCSATLIDENTFINHFEKNHPILTLSMLPKTKQIVSMESLGKIPLDTVEKIIDSAVAGCEDIYELCKTIVLNHIKEGE